MLTAMVIIYDDDDNEDYRRDGAAAVLGNDLVVCGGYAFLGAIKVN